MSGEQPGEKKEYPEIEYQTIMGPAAMAETEAWLNRLGRDGWECCHITKSYNPDDMRNTSHPTNRTYVLRRRKG